MNYKLRSDNKSFRHLGSGSHKFVMQDTKDVVRLSYNESTETFTAEILYPSAHTLYLLDQDRLGIALCKLNTGRSQRKHMSNAVNEEGKDESYRVKKGFHPRWSKCGVGVFPIRSLTGIQISRADVEEYGRFKPNQRHTLNEWSDWYTYIKATLVSRGEHSLGRTSPYEGLSSDRAYKTYSNRIGIQYVSATDKITLRTSGKSVPRSGFIVTQIAPRTFRVSFQRLSDYWKNDTVEIIMAIRDISNPHSHGAYKYDYDIPGNPRQYSIFNFIHFHSNVNIILDTLEIESDDDYIDVTIPDYSDYEFGELPVHSRVKHAYNKAVLNEFALGSFYYQSPILIQVRRQNRDSKMQCVNGTTKTISYNTGLEIDIVTE